MKTIIYVIMLIFGLTHSNETLILASGLFAIASSIQNLDINVKDILKQHFSNKF